MRTLHPSPMLTLALRCDAALTGAVLLLQLVLAPTLAPWLNLPRALLVESALLLVGFVAAVLLIARGPRVWSAAVLAIVGVNVAWAIGCAALWLGGVVQPTVWGSAFLLMHAASVLVFAAWEWAGWRHSRPADHTRLANAH